MQKKYGIVMVDVNGLKRVNDSLGHEAGDELIQGAVSCLTEAFDKEDIVCRIGGDEYAVIAFGKKEEIEHKLGRLRMYKEYFEFSEDVKKAYDQGIPIVAIETGGTFEGIPYPDNVQTALAVSETVNGEGAVPAYIAILDGKIKVGLTAEEMDRYGQMRGKMPKASRREIPLLLAKKSHGVMTLAASMFVADALGISVVSGGGMGGVHRGAETSMDISSDLEEIAVSNVVTVCSGAKSILDLKLTMEYLETKSIPVVGYQTDELPAYMARTSGIKVPCRMDSISEMADAYAIKKKLGIKSGMLFLNPISEEFAVDADAMNAAIDTAIAESIEAGVSGKAITGFLMKRVKEIMGADSMASQKAMLIENAAVAAKLAKELGDRKNESV